MDARCRLAWLQDAAALADIQIGAWRLRYSQLLPEEVFNSLHPAVLTRRWAQAITQTHEARYRVLVAVADSSDLAGYVLTHPALDTDCGQNDGEIDDLTVAADCLGAGHGSRLLHAAIDTLIADGFTRAVTWLNVDDDVLRRFLVASGWDPDGAQRTLDLDGEGIILVRQTRLHVALN